MNENELKNKVFDEMLIYASEQSALDIIKDLPNEENLKETITPSLEFQTKMKKLINRYERKEKYKKLLHISKKVAVILIIFTLLSTITIMSVEAFRIKFFNIITEWNEEYTRFKFEDRNTNLDNNQSSEITQKNNKLIYIPTYIPEGYELLNIQEVSELYRINYTKENKNLTFIQSKIEITDTSMDTEDANVIKVVISGNEGYFIERKDINSLIWQNNEKVFTIHGDIKKNELIKIGESIELQEK